MDGGNQATGIGVLVAASYAYRLVRGLEVGAAVDYWTSPAPVYHILVPALLLRPYLPFDNKELGLSIQAGGLFLSIDDAPEHWLGWGLRVGGDLRWADPQLGFQLGPILSMGKGRRSTDNQALTQYNIGDRAFFIALGLTFGFVWSL